MQRDAVNSAPSPVAGGDPTADPSADPRLCRASALTTSSSTTTSWWLPPGRIVELTGGADGACTSLAVAAVARAQAEGETTAWVQCRHGTLFPPDLAANGVDLDAMLIVHAPTGHTPSGNTRATDHAIPRAAEMLLQSGGFGLVVLDLRTTTPPRGAWLGRLLTAVRRHQSRLLLLTDVRSPLPALGCLVSLRLAPRRAPHRAGPGTTFTIEPHVLQDKLHQSRPMPLTRSGPDGL